MKKAKALKVISKIALIVTIFAFGLSTVGGTILLENADAVNYAFNVKTQEIVKNESTGADTEYFKSDFNSVKEVKENGAKYLELVVGEGVTLLKNENNALPLQENAGVSLFSTSSVSPILVGTGSGAYAEASNIVSLKAGFENAGRGAGGYRSPANAAIFQNYFSFYSGISTGVQDFPSDDLNNSFHIG